MLAGGRLSDTFVFAPGGGSDQVLDLEPWDEIELGAFGYANEAEARANMSPQGGNVVFADQGAAVTFLNTGLDQISDEMILV